MVFSSETFIFLFLPLFLVAYYLTPERLRSWTILIGSYIFYCWWRVDFLSLFVAVTAWAYACGLLIDKWGGQAKAKTTLIVGVIGCLAVLAVFKYCNFFIDSFATLLGTTPDQLGVHWRLILPIGVSFYTFHAIGYIVDVYRKDTPATRSFIDFAAFMALFPHLIAGPVLRFSDLADQFRHRDHSLAMFGSGMYLFTIGLSKKVLIADTVAPVADQAFAIATPTLIEAWLGAIAYMLQLYFDFSGYSDMAIGLGMMIGFQFKPNFNAPYISRSITEFWQRWHMSLSFWLRDYLYIPLGGNRKGTVRTYINLVLVMLLGGLWHGANWTFLVWGGWHGCILAIERATGWNKRSARSIIALPLTLLLVLMGWVVFRAENISDAFAMYQGMLGLNGLLPSPDFIANVTFEHLSFIVLAVSVVFLEPYVMKSSVGTLQVSPDGTATLNRSLAFSLSMTFLMVLSIAKLSEQSFSPFLYFQF